MEAGPDSTIAPGGMPVQGQQSGAGAAGGQGLSELKSGHWTLELSHRGGDERGRGIRNMVNIGPREG